MRPLLLAAGYWPSSAPVHRVTCAVEARTVTSDGRKVTTRWTGGDDGAVVRWEFEHDESATTSASSEANTSTPVAFYGGHSSKIVGLVVNQAHDTVISADETGVLCAWSVGTNVCVERAELGGDDVVSVAIEHRKLVVATSTETIELDLRTLVKVTQTENRDTGSPPTKREGSVQSDEVMFETNIAVRDAWRKDARGENVNAVHATVSRFAFQTNGAPFLLAAGLENGDVLFEPFQVTLTPDEVSTRKSRTQNSEEPNVETDCPVTAMCALDGFLLAGDENGVVRVFDTIDGTPILVTTLVHHSYAVVSIESLPMHSDEKTVLTVDGTGSVGVVTVARRDDGSGAARNEIVFPTNETEDSASKEKSINLVWDPDCGVLIVFRKYEDDFDKVQTDATAWDVLGSRLERSEFGPEAVLFFDQAKKKEGNLFLLVGSPTGWRCVGSSVNATTLDNTFVDERCAGSVARVLSIDAGAVLERNGNYFDKDKAFLQTMGVAAHAWGNDEVCDYAARFLFLLDGKNTGTHEVSLNSQELTTHQKHESLDSTFRVTRAAIGAGGAVSIATPVSGNFSALTKIGGIAFDATRAVVTAALAAKIASTMSTEVVSGVSPKLNAAALTKLNAAALTLATTKRFAETNSAHEYLTKFVQHFHNPNLFVRDAARTLFHYTAVAIDVQKKVHDVTPEALRDACRAALFCSENALREIGKENGEYSTFAENAEVAAACVFVAAGTRLARANALLLTERGDTSRTDTNTTAHSTHSDDTNTTAHVTRALVDLLTLPSLAIVASSASLLAEGVARDEWAKGLSRGALAQALDVTFLLAETCNDAARTNRECDSGATTESEPSWSSTVDSLSTRDSSRGNKVGNNITVTKYALNNNDLRSVIAASSPAELAAARDAVGDLCFSLAAADASSFCERFLKRLLDDTAHDSPAHLVTFLALSRLAHEKINVMEPHLDALARVIVAALAPSKPVLRKRCHPGSSSLAFELSLRSGRCAYYRDALTGVERLAVACCAAEVGDVNVYDLTAASKFRVLRETAEGEGSKEFDPKDAVSSIPNELSNSFSRSVGFGGTPHGSQSDATNRNSPAKRKEGSSSASAHNSIPRVRTSMDKGVGSGLGSNSSTPRGKQSELSPVRRSVDIIPSPDPGNTTAQFAAAAAAAAMALSANANSPGTGNRRSPFTSPRTSQSFSGVPSFVGTRSGESPTTRNRTSVDTTASGTPSRDASKDNTVGLNGATPGTRSSNNSKNLPQFALAFDPDGNRLAGYRDDGVFSKVRVWHVKSSSSSAFSQFSSGLTQMFAGKSTSAEKNAGTTLRVGCAEQFPVGKTVTLSGAESPKNGNSARVSLTWRDAKTIVLVRGEISAAFGVKEA